MSPRYILDTNIFVHLVRNTLLGRRIIAQYGLLSTRPIPVYCVVTAGEILSLALRNGWGIEKLTRLEYLLDYFECQYLDRRKFADNYAVLDDTSRRMGTKMGKNDLWIAATAFTDRFALLTTDRDFDHLAPDFIDRDWIDPSGV